MASGKRKAVVNARERDLVEVEALLRTGAYRTLSEFVREAMAEKLERVRRSRLADQVARFCVSEAVDEDQDLVAAQAFGEVPARAKR